MTKTSSTESSPLGAAALAYARLGFRIFPLRAAGKEPLHLCDAPCFAPLQGRDKVGASLCAACSKKHLKGTRGVHTATTDAAVIAEWWRRHPEANIGIATGGGLYVLDVDGEAGERSLAALEMRHGALPATPEQRTGKGRHLFFSAPPELRNTAGKLGTGLDTRGQGGYVVAAPSNHPSGALYAWNEHAGLEELPLASLPLWVAALLGAASGVSKGAKIAVEAQLELMADDTPSPAFAAKALRDECERVASAAEGTRNDLLNRASFNLGQLVGGSLLNEGEVKLALENAAERCGLSEGEAARTIDSGIRAGIATPRDGPRARAGFKNGADPSSHARSAQKLEPSKSPSTAARSRPGKLPDLKEPTPLVRDMPEAAPYPLEALGPLRAAVEAIQDMLQCPIALAANSVLSVASLAAQGLADVSLLHGQSSPLSLFLLTVGESGERKSAVDRLAMKPVREWEEKLNREYSDKLQAHRNKLAIRVEVEKGIKKKAHKSPDSARRELEQLGDEPLPPVLPYIIVSEPTVEGLTKQLAISRPSMGLFSDEGGAFIGGFSMSDENRLRTSAALSKFWDGDPIDRVRGGDGVLKLYGRRLAVHLLAQPLAVANLLGDPVANGQGLLARFLITHPESTIGTRTRLSHKESSDVALQEFHDRIAQLLRTPFPLAMGAQNELELEPLGRDAEAWNVLAEFHIQTELGMTSGGDFEAVRPFASKAAEHAARVAGVLAIYAGAKSIDGTMMAAAVELTRFYLAESLRLTGGASVSAEMQMAERLRRWLTGETKKAAPWREDFISIRAAMRNGPIRGGDAGAMRKLFTLLQEFGWLTPVEEGASVGGRHCGDAWRIVRGASHLDLPLAS